MPRAEINRRRIQSAFWALQAHHHLREAHIAALLDHEPDWIKGHAFAAAQFQVAVRPIEQVMLGTEGRREQGDMLQIEHKENKTTDKARSLPQPQLAYDNPVYRHLGA